MRNKDISDTLSVTPGGLTVVDVPKLFAKKHMQDMMRRLQTQVKVASRKDSPSSTPAV